MLSGRGDGSRVVTSATGEIPWLVPGSLPEGYELREVSDVPADLASDPRAFEARLWLLAEVIRLGDRR